jgi:iron-sulfur cluster assembly protein
MIIDLTPKAVTQVKKNLQRRGHGHGIKIGIKTTGCSGMAYTLEYVDGIPADNNYYNIEGYEDCMIVSEKQHEFILKGLMIDYVRKGLNEGFEFTNSNESDRCGCGESFRIKS